MGYVDVFGGGPVSPADLSYSSLALTSNVTLAWTTDSPQTSNPFTRVLDVTPTGPYVLSLPNASEASTGQDTIIRNFGAFTLTVADNTGATVASIPPGIALFIYLANNATAAGVWETVVFGSGSSSLSAGSVASPTVIAQANTLNVAFPTISIAATFTALTTHRGNTFVWTGGVGTVNFTAASTLGDSWFAFFHNNGTAALTLDPNSSELIDSASTIALNPTESCMVVSTGSALFTVGLGRSAAYTYTRLAKNVAGSADVTLSLTEAANAVQEFTGILTGNINVIEPTVVGIYYVTNSTTGSFTLTVKTSAGTGVAITQGSRTIVYCDGTNIVSAVAFAAGTMAQVNTGAGLTGGPITTVGTIDIATSAAASGYYNSTGLTLDSYGRVQGVNEVQSNLSCLWGR